MKAITLTQPWASLVSIGAKRIETRSFVTHFRGPLAIHAAQGFPRLAQKLCADEPFHSALCSARRPVWMLPRGAIVATCNLVACRPVKYFTLNGLVSFEEFAPDLKTRIVTVDMNDQERAFGDYSEGRWAWILEDVREICPPAQAKGALGLWNWAGMPE